MTDKNVRRELSVYTRVPEASAVAGVIFTLLRVLGVIHWAWWICFDPFFLSVMASFHLWFWVWLWKREP